MTLISTLPKLTAADIAALDLVPVVDVSAGTSGSKAMYAMAAALGLTKLLYFEDAGGDDAYVISTGLSLTTLTAGFAFALKVTTGNTGACTLTVDGVDAKSIKVVDGSGVRDPLTGEIAAGMTALVSYNGTYFILLNPASEPKPKHILQFSVTGSPIADGTSMYLAGATMTAMYLGESFDRVKMYGVTEDSVSGTQELSVKTTASVNGSGNQALTVKAEFANDKWSAGLYADGVMIAQTEPVTLDGDQTEMFVYVQIF